jgi:ABC-type glycerol-3-phosphate transport system substrate-binding protein
MKIKRSLLAVAVTLAATACSGDVTGPDPSARVPASANQSAATLVETTTTSTTTPTTTAPPEPDPGNDSGSWGSGCCKT